jgi:two-component system sensor histidine kinase GlrK
MLELEVSKQQFMHNVAFEINLPLENILEDVEHLVIEADEEPNRSREDIARRLCNNVDKLKTVAEELVHFSQINSKPEMNHKQTVNMKDLLESVVEDFKLRLHAKSITLKKLIIPVEIFGVNEQLRSIIEQLLLNAVKYSPVGGELRIMLRDSDAQMVLEIEDEGPGIAPEDREHAFEPFFRGKTAQSDECIYGSGLGLAIVKEYVNNHQGKVNIIDSRQGQQGARIRIQMPLTVEV